MSGSITHNQNNELRQYGDITYDYDNNGNLTEVRVNGDLVWTYTYDAANRLIHAEDGTGGIVADYYYDPFGRRLWKEVNGVRTYFFYSDEGLIAEYDGNGQELRSYGYQPDSTWSTDPLWLKQGGEYYFYQNDHLGTPQKLVAVNGTVVWSAQYAAFGSATIGVETVTNNLRFPGQYFDAETGLHYNFHRYYDPGLGRYLRVDPVGFDGGDVNWYGYARENSLKIYDPLGLNEVIITGGINVNFHGWEWPLWRIIIPFSGPIDITRIAELPLNGWNRYVGWPPISHDRKWKNFIIASIKKIEQQQVNLSSCEQLEWHIETGSYMTRAMMDEHGNGMAYIDEIRQDAKKLGVILREYSNKSEFLHNINYTDQGGVRTGDEKISFLAYFGHGYINTFALQYNEFWATPYSLTSKDISDGKLLKTAFSQKALIVSYACNSATENNVGQSMKRVWEDNLGGTFYGVVGRTTYYNTPDVGLEKGAYWTRADPNLSYRPLLINSQTIQEENYWRFP